MPRVTYDYIKNLDPAEIGRMSKSQLTDLLRKIRVKYQTRQKQLNKVKDTVYSPALEKMEDYYDANGMQNLNKISRNKAINEIANLQDFFNAKTSDVSGARAVQREQDIRIFGATKSGRPKQRMTVEQRTQFWSFYNEFINTYKTAEAIYGSGRIQQYLGDMLVQAKKQGKDFSSTELTPSEFQSLLDNLTSMTDMEDDDIDYGGGVFSGSWFNQ